MYQEREKVIEIIEKELSILRNLYDRTLEDFNSNCYNDSTIPLIRQIHMNCLSNIGSSIASLEWVLSLLK